MQNHTADNVQCNEVAKSDFYKSGRKEARLRYLSSDRIILSVYIRDYVYQMAI